MSFYICIHIYLYIHGTHVTDNNYTYDYVVFFFFQIS